MAAEPPKLDDLTPKQRAYALDCAQIQAQERAYMTLTERGMQTAVAIMRGFASPTREEREAIQVLDRLGLPDMTSPVVSSSSAGLTADQGFRYQDLPSVADNARASEATGARKESWKAQKAAEWKASKRTRAASGG